MTTQLQETDFTLIFSPVLARAVKDLGIPHPAEASIFINQISFWLQSGYGHVTKDGTRWIYNSYEKWTTEQFTTLSQWQFGNMVRELAGLGIIEKTCYAHLAENLAKAVTGWHQYRTSSWITLNIERLFELTGCQPHAHKKNPKALPSTEIVNTTTGDRNYNNGELRSQEPTIYKENSTSTQDGKVNFSEKEVEVKQLENIIDPWSEDLTTDTHYADVLEENLLEEPLVTHEGQYSAAPGQGFQKTEQPVIKAKPQVQQIWEIAPKKPFAVFLNWWADKKYKPQGGKWEAAASSNAYSEFYKDCDRTTVAIFPEFLQYMQQVAQNCNQQLAAGIKAILPSCFVERPEATQTNVKQLMINIQELVDKGAQVALPGSYATPSSTQSMAFEIAKGSSGIEPLKQFANLGDSETDPKPSPEEERLEVLKIKQTLWRNAPALRDRIKSWSERQSWCTLTENGPELTNSVDLSGE